MKQISMYGHRVPWIPSVLKLVLVGALAAPNFITAQISSCPDPVRGSRGLKSECADQINSWTFTVPDGQPQLSPLNLTVAPAHPQHRDLDSQMVTIQQLDHIVPKKAKKEREAAESALERKREEDAIGHLENAIQIDPAYVLARNDLAVLYIWMGKPNSAIDQLNEAIKVDPHSPFLFTNLAIGYIAADNFADAERAARSAGELNRAGGLSRYVLAATLYYQNKFTEEALQCALRTSEDYPLAHLFAARIFMERSEFERAKGEIQTYLSGGSRAPVYITTANSWLEFIAAHEPRVVSANP